jgi:hypothetical protein
LVSLCAPAWILYRYMPLRKSSRIPANSVHAGVQIVVHKHPDELTEEGERSTACIPPASLGTLGLTLSF